MVSLQNVLVIRCQVIDKLSGNLRPQFLNAPSSYCAFRSENTSLRINNVSRCQGIKVSGSVRSVTVLPSVECPDSSSTVNVFAYSMYKDITSIRQLDSKGPTLCSTVYVYLSLNPISDYAKGRLLFI